MINMNITKGKVLRYTLLPQVLPRFQDLIASGFAHLAYFMALVYRATNILPENHLYLRADSVGKYSIQNVLVEASRHISFDLKHIDQVVIFFALIAGLFILALQFFFLLLAIFVNPAQAGGLPSPGGVSGIGEFFITPNPKTDLAFRVLDAVFGVPQIFGSVESTETQFHQALHALFQIYSFGLLVVAALILAYLIFSILAETAQTGTPFGRRYNHVWAPIRLVVGVGMLVPMSYGINSGQWITLYAAKFGSGFATQGWIIFNDTLALGENLVIERERLVATVSTPKLKDLSAFMMMAQACRVGLVQTSVRAEGEIDAWVIRRNDGGAPRRLSAMSYTQAVDYIDGGDLYIRFGHRSETNSSDASDVFPYCGEIVLQNTRPVRLKPEADEIYTGESASEGASNTMNQAYFQLIKEMWTTNYQGMRSEAIAYMKRRIPGVPGTDPPQSLKTNINQEAVNSITDAIEKAISEAQAEYDIDKRYLTMGWGSAGIWYNTIADVNGKLITAVRNKPQITKYTSAMEYTCVENQQQNKNTAQLDCYNPNLSKAKQTQYLSTSTENLANALSDLFDYWYRDPDDLTGNIFIDVVNTVLGTEGLFNMCENYDIHPLAQLSALGKGMIEAAVRNLGISFGSGAAGMLTPYFGATLNAASSFFGTMASIGILIGFILFYVVPFLPFLYFLFGLGGWVKGIFEAMVGVPLWALAHLRIDGEGLPGDAAINGYFLIFEIFLRPILLIFGLIASILIFGAMVKVLNDIFTLVVSNLSGFDPESAQGICDSTQNRAIQSPGSVEWMRGPIDEFFFTVVYAIMVYMIGMSCFKLIDLIPNNILRWIGQGLQTFNDQRDQPAEGLLRNIAVGGSVVGQQLGGVVSGAKGAAQGIGGGLVKMTKGSEQ